MPKSKVFDNFMYRIETGLEPPAHVIYRSTRYRELRAAIANLPTGEWFRVEVTNINGATDAEKKSITERFRQAVYNTSDALELRKKGLGLTARTETTPEGGVYVWVGKVTLPPIA